eukprot:m.189705 g.189705  ORF g.189705 m.189705 type:complete len:440 (-) comp32384_c0_seq1:78-1397(-)
MAFSSLLKNVALRSRQTHSMCQRRSSIQNAVAQTRASIATNGSVSTKAFSTRTAVGRTIHPSFYAIGGATLVASLWWSQNQNPTAVTQAQAQVQEKSNLSSEARVGVIPGRENSLLRVAPISGKRVQPEDVDVVLFHGQCPDGFGAALAAYLKLGSSAKYIGISHGKKFLPDDIDGKNVAILDFSFDQEMMAELGARSKSFIVLDHHHSAQQSLANIPDTDKVFEMKMSGCTIAWDFFHGDTSKEIPALLRYLEDKDIWRWALFNSKEFSAAQELLLPVPKPGLVNVSDFDKWLHVLNKGDEGVRDLVVTGKTLLAYQDKLVNRAVRGAQVRRLKLAPDVQAYFVNATVLPSELGNALAEKGRDRGIDYAIIGSYNAKYHSWGLSLRSLYGREDAPNAADVSKIAKMYGGGGHQAAAGMGANVENIEEMFCDKEGFPNE